MKKDQMFGFSLILLVIGQGLYAQSEQRDVKIRIENGYNFIFNGDIGNAIEAFTDAINIDPVSHSAYLGRGKAYSRVRNFENAIRDLSKAIEIASVL